MVALALVLPAGARRGADTMIIPTDFTPEERLYMASRLRCFVEQSFRFAANDQTASSLSVPHLRDFWLGAADILAIVGSLVPSPDVADCPFLGPGLKPVNRCD